jgi:hypothetical protein
MLTNQYSSCSQNFSFERQKGRKVEKSSLDSDGLKPETYGTEVITPTSQGPVEEFHFSSCNYKFFGVIHVSLQWKRFWITNALQVFNIVPLWTIDDYNYFNILLKSNVVWDVTPYSMVEVYCCFGPADKQKAECSETMMNF